MQVIGSVVAPLIISLATSIVRTRAMTDSTNDLFTA
jgi:hypothetical protein